MRGRRAFTLVELLVVIVIVILVSAVALPTVLPALTSRKVGEAARILQAALAGARDAAIRYNAPRGIRLLPDATLSDLGPGPIRGQRLTASRVVPIEPAPDLTDSSANGSATFRTANVSWDSGSPPVFPFPPVLPAGVTRGTYPYPVMVTPPGGTTAVPVFNVLMVVQAPVDMGRGTFNPPTNWFWNVRVGDRFRFNDSGRYYTVVGPMTVANPENFVNDGAPDAVPSLHDAYPVAGTATPVRPEFLFLVNGQDDNLDGYADNGVDGVDLNPNAAGALVPDGNVDDVGEWTERETWLGSQARAAAAAENSVMAPPTFKWTIARRPVPSPGAREVTLPAVVDLTTWDSTFERSRVPVDPFNGTVDVLINQAGQVVPTTYYSSPSSFTMAGSFYHFWVADRADVTAPAGSGSPRLPVSTDAANLPSPLPAVFLKKDRVLVTLFSRTGQVVTNSVENFDYADTNRPFDDAQLGVREAK